MHTLRSAIDSIASEDLLRIRAPLDDVPTAVVMALQAKGRSPVVLIEPVSPDAPAVVVNLFGDRRRVARLVGLDDDDFYSSWGRRIEKTIAPVLVNGGPAQEQVSVGDAVDCTALPLSHHFENDGGRYINSGIVVCRDPDTGVANLSFARMQLKGPQRFAINLGSRGDLWEHHKRAAASNRNLEIAVVIGAPPALYVAAAAKVAMTIDEYTIAGAFMGKPVELTACHTVDLAVPADAEYVIEGEILAHEEEDEGPMAEYTGYSTARSTRNVFAVKALTHRAKPIFLDITPGASQEHLILAGIGRQARDYVRLKEMIPGLKAINFPASGSSYHAYVSLRRPLPGEARRALTLLFGLDPYLKTVVAVDEDVDVFDEADVLWALATRFQADRDLFVVPKVLCNRGDPSGIDGMSAKMGLDATVPADWPEQRATVSDEARAAALELMARYRL